MKKKFVARCASSGKFCSAMDEVMSPMDEAGISPFMLYKFADQKHHLRGVLFKRRQRDRGVLFNFCPFCKVDYRKWLKPSLTKGVPPVKEGDAYRLVPRKRQPVSKQSAAKNHQ